MQKPVLAVDLDGTLLRSDLVWESLLVFIAPAPWRIFLALFWLIKGGRPLMKTKIGERVEIDPTLLPWNQATIAFCEKRASEGGKVILATASDEKIAKRLAGHFSFFSQILGSVPGDNLKSARKSERLTKDFGAFDYIGDTYADLAVWKNAETAYFVGTESKRNRLASRLGKPLVFAAETTEKKGIWARAMRQHQWLKNLLVFVPLIAAHRTTDLGLWAQVLPAFVALCYMASASYLLNDLLDLASDRRHERKRNRPFASGDLLISSGICAIAGLFLVGLLAGALSGMATSLAVVAYFALSTWYSSSLKRTPVVDVLVLAGLYTYRILVGGIACSVFVSPWLLAFSTTFFLGLAFLKRFVEIDGAQEKTAIPGRGYTREDRLFVIVAGVASSFLSIVVLALYLDSAASSVLYRYPQWLWGIDLALLIWNLRAWFLASRKQMDDDPVWFAAKDPVTLAIGVICVLSIGAASPIPP